MVIVTVTRNDLRDEFAMADEAFALSPISARAALPSEADYDAIREAFMETSRGRWFLTEYAKRNRNADTSMVLDAVTRIEQTLAAQKQATTDDGLAEALVTIRSSLAQARTAAIAALDKQALDEDVLAPIRKGVRIIREISWRWREIGGDGRICDLIDSQASAIEAAQEQLAARDDVADLQAAFDMVANRIDAIAGGGSVPPSTSPADNSSAERAAEAFAPAAETTKAVPATADAAIFEQQKPVPVQGGVSVDAAEAVASEPADEPAPTRTTDELAADDDALLDMIALEMGAPDFNEPEIAAPAMTETTVAESPAAQQEALSPIAIAPDVPEPEAASDVTSQPSLGASLLASGIVASAAPRSDPLAPIRRMTQVEKVAFFS